MHRALIIQTAFLGDVVLSTALIEKLHAHFPDARIDFLLRRGNEGLLEGHPHLGEVLVLDKSRKWTSLRRLVRRVRAARYDLVVNAQRFLTSGLLAVSSGAREIVGFDKNPLSMAYTRRLPHRIGKAGEDAPHEVDRNHSLIRHLTDERAARPRLYPPPEAYAKVAREGPYVCLAPTSVWFTKQWPAERWTALCDLVPETWGITLLGGPADRTACEQIARATRHPVVENRAGDLSLLESAALMQGAAMTFANDSAPVHLASAVNAPITEIYASTVPAFGFTPLSDRSVVVQTTESLPCRPCGLHGRPACPEGHFRCAMGISARQVWDAAMAGPRRKDRPGDKEETAKP